ncbi:AI-2E family transporter [Zeaxanthinibacter sp. PT1]|uniref:AI-2E family transporter n=1 Tax=Zeaxanthinibacter TaxID=561554 RepID=UPI002349EC6B|nr:AI-2E family transporter [Zeaxanthinibacter sp. PT1]MDC6350444.1 AI-2E family transporter [Zeaxanthinibacter sp. PT1]
MKTIDPKIIRQLFILSLIVFIGLLIMKNMMPYLSGVLGAITIYVLLRKPMAKLVRKGWHPDLASGLLMLASFICILIPVGGLLMMLGNKVSKAVQNSERFVNALREQLKYVEDKVNYDLTAQLDSEAFSGWVSNNLQSVANSTFEILISLVIMYFLLYYMLTNRSKLRESLYEYIPIGEDNLKMIGKDVKEMVRANALGIPLVAIAQGIVALIGFLIFKIDSPFFWAGMVAIGSMIPFVGALLGTIPAFILTLSAGDDFAAFGILIYGLVVVGSTDNFIRLYVLRRLDNVHPLITLIGVLVGVPLFGFIGLIFGPLLLSLFLVIVRIYKKEYGRQETL